MPSVAIVGAGCSGLAAAHILRDKDWSVTLFEKDSMVGGRAATQARDGFIYDHGAQYIKPGTPECVSWITGRFLAPGLLDIAKPVWIFDGKGHIQEGDAAQNAEEKWTYRDGLIMLAKRMAEDLDIHLETTIDHALSTDSGWSLVGEPGREFGPFDYLLLTLPIPQARELLRKSRLERDIQEEALQLLTASTYRPLLSIMLGYRPVPRRRLYYALVNTDKAHAISWLAWEHEKASERAPQDAGLLIAQMAPSYSASQWERNDAELVRDCALRVSQLVGEALSSPYFSDVQRWRYALPSDLVDDVRLHALTLPLGLAFCGDGFVGGRVHRALEHGMQVARLMLERY